MHTMKRTDNKKYCTSGFFLILLTVFMGIPPRLHGETLASKTEKGNSLYQEERYDEAMKSFVDAQIESPEEPKLKYNLANTHYKMNNYEEAVKNYQDVAATAEDIQLEEKSLYNIGNALYRQGKLEEAIEFYKKALELDPDDQDAKYNLEFVREEIKRRLNEAKQREEQQEEEKQSCEQEQQEEQEQQGEGNQEEQQQEEQQQQQTQQQQQQEEQQQEEMQQEEQESGGEKPAQAKPMTPEEAERWLQSLKEGKKKPPQQEKRRGARSFKPDKDW